MNIKKILKASLIVLFLPVAASANRTSSPITADNGVIACDTCVTTTGTQSMTNKTITQPSFVIQQSATPGPTAEGEMWWDTNDDVLLIGNGSGTTTVGSGGGGGGGSADPAGANMQVQYNNNSSFGGDADFTFNNGTNTLGIPNISSPTSMSLQIDSDNNGTETFKFKNGAGTEICSIDESGNFQIDGDLTVSGDDLVMATNTSGYILVADGTNFNPVAVSSDIAISNAGAVTIQANSVALGTDTAGAYVGSATSNGGLSVVGSDDAVTIGIAIGNTPDDASNGAVSDSLIIFDASDSNNVKRVLVSEVAALVADGNTVDMGSGFVIEDTDGDEITLVEDKEMAILEGAGIDVNWTDTSNGSDGDPYDLTISINSDVVTLTGSQTLTNKTLTSPTLNTATINAPTTLTLTQGASVAPTAEGVIAWDSDDDELKIGNGSGTVTIGAGGGGGASSLNGLSDVTIASASSAQILVHDGSDSFDNKTVSGDITISTAGAVSIGADKITTAMLNDASDSPSAGECLKVASTTSQIEYAACTTTSADVSGPSSSTDNALPRFDGTGGKTLQASDAILDDSENLSGLTSVASAADASIIIQSDTDVNFRVDADADSFSTFNFKNGSNTTVATISEAGSLQVDGDLTISGDDLVMATNTSGAILVGDGTNYNPVAMSGDVSINSSGVSAVSASLTGLTTIGAAGATTNFAAGDVTIFNPVTDGSPSLSLGKDASDRLLVTSTYNSGAQSIDKVEFSAITSSSTADDGRIVFDVDGVDIVTIDDGGIESYIAVADANPSLKMGSAAAESLSITSTFDSGTQNLDSVEFATATADTGADEGRIIFDVDGTDIATIDDGGLSLSASKGLDVAGTAILADSSGTMTLSNVDALDATTEATTEAAIDTLANLTSLGAAGATTNVAAGDVTFYNPVNGGNPSLSLGSSSAERLSIVATYDSSAQTLDNVEFATAAASGTADKGKMVFDVDGTNILQVDDAGLDILVDAGQIGFGADSEIVLSHDADDGLDIKHTATGDDKPVKLVLKTGETDIAVNDVLGAINFQAPDEGTGTDAILVAAGIEAVSEGDFSSSSNATKLSFKTASSAAAAETMSLSSGGNLSIAGDLTISGDDLFMGTNTSGFILVADGTNFNPVAVSGDVAISNAGATTIQANSVALSTDTTGNYVASATSNGGLELTGTEAGSLGIAHANVTADGDAGATGDSIMIFDTSNSDALKRITLAELDTLIDTDTNTQLTEEQVEDFVGGMLGGTETGITVTYNDTDNDIDFVVADLTVAGDTGSTAMTPGETLTFTGGTNITTSMSGDALTITGSAHTTDTNLTEEEVEDFVGTMVAGGTETNIAVTYTDGGDGAGVLNFVVADAFLINSGDDTMAGTLTAKGVNLSDGATGPGLVKILEDTDLGSNFTSITVGNMASDAAYTLPTALPDANKILQSTDAGVLSWVSDTDTNTNQLTTFTLTADSGANQTIDQGSTFDIAGGTNATTVVSAADTVTINVNDAFLVNSGDDTTSGTITAKGVTVTDGSTGPGLVKILEDTDNGTNYASFTVGALSENTAYTLPTALPGGNRILQSTDAGVLSWVADTDTDTNTQLTEEQVEDFVGGMLGGTETNIAVTYTDGGDGAGVLNFVVADAFLVNSGDDTMAGTLTAKGVTLSDGSTGPGLFKILEDTDLGSNFTSFTVGNMVSDAAYTLPTALPASNKVLQSTNGGVMSWVEQSGSVTAINNATANELVTIGSTTTELDAEANLTFDTDELKIDADSSNDPELEFSLDNASAIWTVGIDDSDNDYFKIDSGDSLTDDSDFEMDSSGNVTTNGGVTTGCTPGSGTADCGITLTDNTANPSDPGSGKTMLHTKDGSLYVYHDGDTTPGFKVATEYTMHMYEDNLGTGANFYTAPIGFAAGSATAAAERIPAPETITITKIVCAIDAAFASSGSGRTVYFEDNGTDDSTCKIDFLTGNTTGSDTCNTVVTAGHTMTLHWDETGAASGQGATCTTYYRIGG